MNPFVFRKNRVWRVYKGGKLLDELQGVKTPVDGDCPEEWIASMVKANNPERNIVSEGISNAVIDGKDIPFDRLIDEKAEELLGKKHVDKYGKNTGYLTKLLDSAVRLPLQAHPDNKMSLELYKSKYGKTEAWIVLETRKIQNENPYLIVGFNEKLEKDVFIKEAVDGDMQQSLSMVHKHNVKPGDILLIKGGMVHAIGPGVFLTEIMEPTDFVVQPELYCADHKLCHLERFGGLNAEDAVKVFHYQTQSAEEAWSSACIKSELLEKTSSYELTMLMDRNKIKYFGAMKLALSGTWKYSNIYESCVTGIVIRGSFTLKTKQSEISLKRGNTFFIPYSVNSAELKGDAEIIFTLPPV